MNRNSLQVFQTFIFSYVRLPRAFLVSCTCCGKQFSKRTKSGSIIQNPSRSNEGHALFFPCSPNTSASADRVALTFHNLQYVLVKIFLGASFENMKRILNKFPSSYSMVCNYSLLSRSNIVMLLNEQVLGKTSQFVQMKYLQILSAQFFPFFNQYLIVFLLTYPHFGFVITR